MLLQEKQAQLHSILKQYGMVCIAFSGGVDSALLVKCALDTLGVGNVLALFAQSELLTPGAEPTWAASCPRPSRPAGRMPT